MSREWRRSAHRLTRRLLGVGLLLTVFFLPLHVHAASAVASQLTKECVCLHGSRLQAEFASAPVSCAPLLVIGEVAPLTRTAPASLSIHNPFSRAPPQPVSR